MEEHRARTPGEIDIAFDIAVGHEARHLQSQRVLKALEVHAIQYDAIVVAAECLGLRAAERRCVVQRDVLQREVGCFDAKQRAPTVVQVRSAGQPALDAALAGSPLAIAAVDAMAAKVWKNCRRS